MSAELRLKQHTDSFYTPLSVTPVVDNKKRSLLLRTLSPGRLQQGKPSGCGLRGLTEWRRLRQEGVCHHPYRMEREFRQVSIYRDSNSLVLKSKHTLVRQVWGSDKELAGRARLFSMDREPQQPETLGLLCGVQLIPTGWATWVRGLRDTSCQVTAG